MEAVKRLYADLSLNTHFKWDVPKGGPLEIPNTLNGSFASNVYLKENYAPLLRDDPDFGAHFWLIREWGGIKSFKDSPANREKIKLFREQRTDEKLTKAVFSVISSLSKVAAFENCDRFAIYDARAIVALNWLIFCHDDSPRLFPQPLGRNTALLDYDPYPLMRLSGKAFTFRSHKTAFFEYCDLLRELCVEALDGVKLYHLEMLLFVAAPTWIVKDIRERTSVSIKC